MDNNAVAERIKFLMKELNYRQVDFAQKIDVDTSNLSKYLNGRLAMSEALINKIVVNLGVSKQWLETGEDLPFAKQQPQQLVTVPDTHIVTEPTVAWQSAARLSTTSTSLRAICPRRACLPTTRLWALSTCPT